MARFEPLRGAAVSGSPMMIPSNESKDVSVD